MPVDKTIARANEEVAANRLWRAREILGSSISTYGYSREIYQALGEVLLKMGDELEAVKCFLLSVDNPNQPQMDAIKLFLTRCSPHDYKSVSARFPACARIESRDDYPKFLRRHLAEIGAPEKLRNELPGKPEFTKATEILFSFGCILFGILFFACAIIGAYNALLFITTWLYSS